MDPCSFRHAAPGGYDHRSGSRARRPHERLTETGVSLSASVSEEKKYSRIVIQYAPAPEASPEEIVNAEDRVRARITKEIGDRGPIDVAFSDDGEAIETEATVRGGRRLTSADGECTSGFTVKRSSSGNRGVLTARHCPNNLKYRGISGVIEFGADAQTVPDGRIDIQFHRTLSGNSTDHTFRASSSDDERNVHSVANPPDDSWVCKRGVATGTAALTSISPILVQHIPTESPDAALLEPIQESRMTATVAGRGSTIDRRAGSTRGVRTAIASLRASAQCQATCQRRFSP